MVPAEGKIGHVLRYAYLWHRQQQQGREEGDKDRPCLVVALMRMEVDGRTMARVLPITHSPPTALADAAEIPLATKLRLGLDMDRSWIVLTESNRFLWPGPDLRPSSGDGYLGAIPPALFARVREGFVANARAGRHTSVERTV